MELLYWTLLFSELFFAVFVFIILFKIPAPYGKFQTSGWGVSIPAKFSWLVMEFPAVFIMFLFFFLGHGWEDPSKIIFLLIWQLHYLRRTFVYPFRIKSARRFPILLTSFAFIFNCMNGYINGFEVFIKNFYSGHWLQSPMLYIGIILFLIGYRINSRADKQLQSLKRKSDGSYQVPRGGLFEQVSCPHYLGEILEWLGWAVMTWSMAGFAFFIFSIANLAPRAYLTHQWYKQHFPDYPEKRKVLIPGTW